jgi:TonB family protein
MVRHRLLAIAALTLGQAVSDPTAIEETAKSLPGNRACAYPTEAEARRVSGPVHFIARVTGEGTTESVEITAQPLVGLGFEEAVRTCVADWRFEPAPAGASALRTYRGVVRYRIAKDEEVAIRPLLESLAAAWNARDEPALEELGAQAEEREPYDLSMTHSFLDAELASVAKGCYVVLHPDVGLLQFLRSDVADLTQAFTCVPPEAAGPLEASETVRTFHLGAVKGHRGWRFARSKDVPFLGFPRVGSDVAAPKKLKHVKPVYAEAALTARVQGIVLIDCVISAEGDVTPLRLLRGIPPLDQAAIDAVKQWKYAPTLRAGHAVPVAMAITVEFRLP